MHPQILTNLRKIIRAVNLESKRLEKEHGISIPQLLCLIYLKGKTDFSAAHKEIKDYLQLNASTVTGIISRLEKKGLVARMSNQTDKRVGLIVLTAKGAVLLDKTPNPLHEQLSRKLNQLSPDRLQVLLQAFDLIIDFLNIENVDAAPIFTGGRDIGNSEIE